VNERVLLGFSPLLDESDFSASNHIELVEEILERFGKKIENVICFVGDNCATNIAIAKECNIPIVGMILLSKKFCCSFLLY
jgi:hypothetical protein